MSNITANAFIGHGDVVKFSDNRVNLPRELASEYRDQVTRLCERLAVHIAENPGFGLIKMIHAGSVAKGTALKTINDLDVAAYLKKEKAPVSNKDLVPWLAERLREANPLMNRDQFDETQPHCVTVQFRGSGLDVDVVPVLTDGCNGDYGYLNDRHTGSPTLTNITLHLEFIRNRKKKNPVHYAQVVRLVKWWAQHQKSKFSDFKCKSFLIELLVAHLADRGLDLSDYPRVLESVFTYIVKTGFQERIAFADYYSSNQLPKDAGAPMEIFDPVNPENNIVSQYTLDDRGRIVKAAEEAADAVSEGIMASTKGQALECWQLVLGPSFRG